MGTTTNISLGVLLIAVLSTSFYITLEQSGLRMRIDDDKTTFYGKNEANRWVVTGREYNKLYDGSSLMNRRTSEISREMTYDPATNTSTFKRTTPYIRGPIITDTYFFDGNIEDIESFPVSHTVEIQNAAGKFYRYEVRDLIFEGEAAKLDTTMMLFGMNMKVIWQPGYNWARVYKSGILKVQYKIKSDYEKFNVRLYDPKDPPTELNYEPITECINSTETVREIKKRKEDYTECDDQGKCTTEENTINYIEEKQVPIQRCTETGVLNNGKEIKYNNKKELCLRTENILCCWDKKDGGMNLENRAEEFKTQIRSGEKGFCIDLNNKSNKILAGELKLS